jgi:hypothetical protein
VQLFQGVCETEIEESFSWLLTSEVRSVNFLPADLPVAEDVSVIERGFNGLNGFIRIK